MDHNPIVWFEIYVDDITRAKSFYESVLQVTLTSLLDPTEDKESSLTMYAFPSDMEQHGASGALVCVDGFPAGSNSTIVYFSCEDCAVEESRVEKAGGRIQRSKMSIGEYGFISLIEDTEGNMVGLHSLQ
ncbi:VOC family protein [Alteromonas sp. H39]|uniref:VOC family protein n=1 Tax=Alteromonas sp. H39 TaxID=3389876 RepID=UPI0039E135DA